MRDLFVFRETHEKMSLDDKLEELSKLIAKLKKVEDIMGDESKQRHIDEFEKKKKEGEAPEGYDKEWWELAKENERLLNSVPTPEEENKSISNL